VKAAVAAVANGGAPVYATALRQPLVSPVDALLPDNWRECWNARRLATHLEAIDPRNRLSLLGQQRRDVEAQLARAYATTVVKRTWLKLTENANDEIRAALQAYLTAIRSIGRGTGRRAVRYRQDARNAASVATSAVPCWIMAHHRVSESLPAQLGVFDLVIIDEASQSDLTALPALFRAKKVLIVGDDKQVSPEGVGVEEEKTRALMSRFLHNQVDLFRAQMDPVRSMYDLFKVVFASKAVMLKEHFRCVNPIIEYSKREFYNHELRPLRLPRASERLDPPLVDILVADGYRRGDINPPEARVIVDEIKALTSDPRFGGRSIGVVSLLADKQAILIWDMLTSEIGPEIMQAHDIACGDARTFQGKERDIMFLSMVAAPGNAMAISRDTFAQRFNVAASRARDRMYLVRSLELSHLSSADVLRRGLISHFSAPFANDDLRVSDLRELCESDFEREVYDALVERGYRVTPQVRAGHFRIDLVVEGDNDRRLAVECDGDQYHGIDKWADDMQRQSVLERAGWTFWRCFASAFVRRRAEVLDDLIKTLALNGIEPSGSKGAGPSIHTESRLVNTSALLEDDDDDDDDEGDEDDDEDDEDGDDEDDEDDDDEDDEDDDVESLEVSSAEPPRIEGGVTVGSSGLRPFLGSELKSSSPTTVAAPDVANRLESDPLPRLGVLPRSENRSAQHPEEEERSASPGTPEDMPGHRINRFEAWKPHYLPDPRTARQSELIDAMVEIVSAEGPILSRRLYQLIVKASGGKRVSKVARSSLNRAQVQAVKSGRLLVSNPAELQGEIVKVVRLPGMAQVLLRERGERSLEEIPIDEIAALAQYLREVGEDAQSDIKRAILDRYGLVRMTPGVREHLDRCLRFANFTA
jgi:very-short-patch-repair endonuclease